MRHMGRIVDYDSSGGRNCLTGGGLLTAHGHFFNTIATTNSASCLYQIVSLHLKVNEQVRTHFTGTYYMLAAVYRKVIFSNYLPCPFVANLTTYKNKYY